MSLTINTICHGFKVLEASFVEEVHSKAYILEHLHSGARLLYLANDDDNKVFSIAFRTPPKYLVTTHRQYRCSAYSGAFFPVWLAQVSFKGALCRPCEGLVEYLFERYDLSG